MLFARAKHLFIAVLYSYFLRNSISSSDIADLRKQRNISSTGLDVLGRISDGVAKDVFLRTVANAKKGRPVTEHYSPEMRAFALTLKFYSTKAYSYPRLKLGLPSLTTIQKLFSNLDGLPGVIEEAFKALAAKAKAEEGKREIIAAVMLDDMKI